jgi:hypothetical protein
MQPNIEINIETHRIKLNMQPNIKTNKETHRIKINMQPNIETHRIQEDNKRTCAFIFGIKTFFKEFIIDTSCLKLYTHKITYDIT